MFEEAALRDKLQQILSQQVQAAAAYTSLAGKLDDQQLAGHFVAIGRDKQRHVRLTERLLEIVQ